MLSDSVILVVLFAVAAGLGWYFAKRTGKAPNRQHSGIQNLDYFKGVNYLLNEQPDEALEVFLRMVDVDQNTAETHFALGGLFRKRGEVDRAIRIHQNLMARPNLEPAERNAAMFALAQDYLSAGLLDRAEGLLRQVSQVDAHRPEALQGLIRIYEAQKDWEKALLAHKNLLPINADSSVAAHYHCELALKYLQAGEIGKARDQLKEAKGKHRGHARSAIIRGELAEKMEDWKLARRLYRSVMEERPEYAVLVLNALMRSVQKTGGDKAFEKLLQQIVKKTPKAKTFIAHATIVDSQFVDPTAEQWAGEAIRSDPHLRSLLARLTPETDSIQPDQAMEILRALVPEKTQFLCHSCGLLGTTMYWQCPSCKSWDTTLPDHRLQFETSFKIAG